MITVIQPTNGKLIKFEITDTAIAEMKEQYMPLKIAGIDDRNGFNIVHNARMIVKGKRILVEKKRKELNTDAKAYINSVNSEAERITNLLSPIEDYLEGEETRIEQERETIKREAIERENKRIQDRINQISAYGYAVDYSEIKGMTDIAFNDLLEQARIEYKKDMAAKLEAERLRIEETERLIKERAELEAMRKQQQYEANILKAEQVEQEARERAIKAQQDKIDAEKLQQQKVIEDQLKNERLAKEAEALRPDREKLQAFVQVLIELKLPDVKGEEAIMIIGIAADRMDQIITDINEWLKKPSVMLATFDPAAHATIVEGDLVNEIK